MEKFIIITTCSDDLDVIKKLANILLDQKLVASCHITPIDSSYWWNDEIVHNREYKQYLIQMIIQKIIYK